MFICSMFSFFVSVYSSSVVSLMGFRVSNRATESDNGDKAITTLNHEGIASVDSTKQPMKFLNMVYGEDRERAKEGLNKIRCVILA